MPTETPVTTGRFVPQIVRPSYLSPQGATATDTSSRTSASEAALAVLLSRNQSANLDFDPGTLGDSSYIGDNLDQRITRGYIRRASPESSDIMSKAQLNFMYNPEAVVRDYVSYLDQEALDPFNTVYNSGNLIAPPSFINFSFNLFFDRQVQTAKRVTPRGVLEDYDFFDMVVRNVAPGGGTTAVPDNGIMMVNPKDIMVVFSKHLTVQGRPTNAQVVFERFNSDMTPVRMSISLTLIVTYFGPLRDDFTLDTSQAIGKWEATIPYKQLYNNEVTQADADAAQAAYNKSRGELQGFLDAIPRNVSWANAANVGGGVSTIGTAASGNLARDTLQYGIQNIKQGVTQYTQGSGRANLPTSADCSGAVYCCYKAYGAAKVLHGSEGPASTASIASWGRANGWKTMQIVCEPRKVPVEQLKQACLPGDVLLRTSSAAHTGFFNSWSGGGFLFTHQTSGGNNGTVPRSMSYLQSFDWVLRPNPSGSTTTTGTWIPIGSSDPGGG